MFKFSDYEITNAVVQLCAEEEIETGSNLEQVTIQLEGIRFLFGDYSAFTITPAPECCGVLLLSNFDDVHKDSQAYSFLKQVVGCKQHAAYYDSLRGAEDEYLAQYILGFFGRSQWALWGVQEEEKQSRFFAESWGFTKLEESSFENSNSDNTVTTYVWNNPDATSMW